MEIFQSYREWRGAFAYCETQMQECKELQEKIAAQTFNRDDVIRMKDERSAN